jgi:hypothetical protein
MDAHTSIAVAIGGQFFPVPNLIPPRETSAAPAGCNHNNLYVKCGWQFEFADLPGTAGRNRAHPPKSTVMQKHCHAKAMSAQQAKATTDLQTTSVARRFPPDISRVESPGSDRVPSAAQAFLALVASQHANRADKNVVQRRFAISCCRYAKRCQPSFQGF